MLQEENSRVMYLSKKDKVREHKNDDTATIYHFGVDIIQYYRDNDVVIYKTEDDRSIVLKTRW